MRSNSFETQEMREIGLEGSRSIERLSHLKDGNDRCLPDKKKRNVKTRKD